MTSFRLLLLFLFLSMKCLYAQPQKYPQSLIVAQDGSGNYKTIQDAVNSVRDLGKKRVIIYIRTGMYHEKLVIPSWKRAISLIGDSTGIVTITNADYSGKAVPGGKDAFGKDEFSTYTSYTVLVQGNDITLENLTIENTSGKVGQAVALHIEGDRSLIKNCRILGNQDTLYSAKEGSRQYYLNCYIEGTTDFIFGEATCVFQNCTIKSLGNSYITAASTRPGQKFGFVFMDCKLIADTGVTKVYLGRPWRPYAKTVFIRTQMGSHILPQGWDPWKGDAMFPDKERTTYYAEYKSSGAGSKSFNRVKWSHQLTGAEVKKYTSDNIFSGNTEWILNE